MSVSRAHVLAEIRRTAEAHGGQPLGRDRFADETGIRPGDWLRFWARWGDALQEAGFEPNVLRGRYEDDAVLGRLVAEIRRLGRMPTIAEMQLLRRQDSTFPSAGVYAKFGPKRVRARRVAEYCRQRPDCADVLAIVEPLLAVQGEEAPDEGIEPTAFGFVYLLRSGRYYKIGRTNAVGRREYELAIQLPEPALRIHTIRTDDPAGIEAYWHRRFADRRKGGEWFELTKADVAAFKRRKFM